jgi:hypothetical protein
MAARRRWQRLALTNEIGHTGWCRRLPEVVERCAIRCFCRSGVRTSFTAMIVPAGRGPFGTVADADETLAQLAARTFRPCLGQRTPL